MKKLKKTFLLQYVYEFEDGHDCVKLLGAFSSKDKVKRALAEIIKIPELKKMKKNFIIDEDEINLISWEEGFTNVNGPYCTDLPPFVVSP